MNTKDPAFLFYSSDFLSGTFTMTNEQIGKYIRLLCIQHQKYILSEKDMLNICGTYDEDIYCKFKKENNVYYNERLRFEAERRKNYAESRRNNRKKTENDEKTSKDDDMNNICKSYDEHMETETETVNENINVNKNEKKQKIEKSKILFSESKYFDLEILKIDLEKCNAPYNVANAEYYHHAMSHWSKENNQKKIDWLATCQNWILRDFKDGKLIDKNYKPKNGNSNNKSEYQNGRTPFDGMHSR